MKNSSPLSGCNNVLIMDFPRCATPENPGCQNRMATPNRNDGTGHAIREERQRYMPVNYRIASELLHKAALNKSILSQQIKPNTALQILGPVLSTTTPLQKA